MKIAILMVFHDFYQVFDAASLAGGEWMVLQAAPAPYHAPVILASR
jgi:hypothetical protein